MSPERLRMWQSCLAEGIRAYEIGSYDKANHVFAGTVKQITHQIDDCDETLSELLHIYANVKREMNELTEAMQLYERALKVLRLCRAEDDATTASIYKDMALCQCLAGEFRPAVDTEKKVLAICDRVSGRHSEQSCLALIRLISLCWILDDTASACLYLEQYINHVKKHATKFGANLVDALSMLGRCYFKNGRYWDAELTLQEALKQCPDHHISDVQRAAIGNRLGLALCAQGKHEEARPICLQSASTREGCCHHNQATSATLNDVADVYCAKSDFQQARVYCELAEEERDGVPSGDLQENLATYARLLKELGCRENLHRIEKQLAKFRTAGV
ncbi:MAG TPA: tetratricopeptide repeat protein [Candidatus Obscuribacterales bacterium]